MNEKEFEITIESIAFGGDGVGHLPDGRICFVRGGVPGDEVRVRLTADKRGFARGKVDSLLRASERRIDPGCPVAAWCPGCSYRFLPYQEEIAQKQKQFEYFMTRGGLVPAERILPPFPAPERDFQRTRLKLACEGGRAGYRGFDNTTLVALESCRLAVPEINTALKNAMEQKALPHSGEIFFRAGKDGVFSFDSRKKPHDHIIDYLPGFGEFTVPVGSFFQTNRAVGAELARRTAEAVCELQPERMIELYCGVGIFSIVAAEALPSLHCTGMEIDSDAIHSARINAETRKVAGRCNFVSADAGRFSEKMKNDRATLLLVDPPRTGLAPETTAEIAAFAPEWIVYISCSPDTLRRDLERFGDYEVLRTGLADMFPGTAHFESFTILKRKAV